MICRARLSQLRYRCGRPILIIRIVCVPNGYGETKPAADRPALAVAWVRTDRPEEAAADILLRTRASVVSCTASFPSRGPGNYLDAMGGVKGCMRSPKGHSEVPCETALGGGGTGGSPERRCRRGRLIFVGHGYEVPPGGTRGPGAGRPTQLSGGRKEFSEQASDLGTELFRAVGCTGSTAGKSSVCSGPGSSESPSAVTMSDCRRAALVSLRPTPPLRRRLPGPRVLRRRRRSGRSR